MTCGRHHRHIASSACVVAVLFVSTACASLGRFETLTLTASVPDREFLVLEPIPFNLELENRTGRGVRGHTALEFLARHVALDIQPEGSSPYRVDNLTSVVALVDIAGRIIKPGEKREVTEVLGFGLTQILPRPGRYAIHVVLHGIDRQDELTSNAVSIVVREPDRFEREAQDQIQSSGIARDIFTPRGLEERRPYLEEIAERFGDTPYGDYANLLLGEYHAVRRDVVSAQKYLSRIAGKPEFPLAERAAKLLAELGAP